MKIRSVEAELFHTDKGKDRQTDRQTDMTKLRVASLNFANARKNIPRYHQGNPNLCAA
jgi:hypothetical protein